MSAVFFLFLQKHTHVKITVVPYSAFVLNTKFWNETPAYSPFIPLQENYIIAELVRSFQTWIYQVKKSSYHMISPNALRAFVLVCAKFERYILPFTAEFSRMSQLI